MIFEGNEFCGRNGCGNFLTSSFLGPEIFVAIFVVAFIFLAPIFFSRIKKKQIDNFNILVCDFCLSSKIHNKS